MQTDNKLLDDLARVAASALGTLQGVRDEVEARLRDQFERILNSMDLVTREEFDAVKAMAVTARCENESLKTRIEALEASMVEQRQPASGGRKPKSAAAGKKRTTRGSGKTAS
jgi:BMFP domain-containing protein YqiC